MDASVLEMEEILNFVENQMPHSERQVLRKQVFDEPNFELDGHRPCPFLNRQTNACAIYPVRPMGCRGLLAYKECKLEVNEDTGLEFCVEKAQKAWQKTKIPAGMLLVALEHSRKQKGHFNLNQNAPEFLIKFKILEPELLKLIF